MSDALLQQRDSPIDLRLRCPRTRNFAEPQSRRPFRSYPQWMRRLLIVIGVLLLPLAAARAQPDAPRPNILLILADDLGHALIQPGSPLIPTPNLDRLRAQSATFTSAYATAPVCGPSRAGLITGQYQQRLGFEFNPDPRSHEVRPGATIGLRPNIPTLPALLDDAGYDTALIGKWHLGSRARQHPLRRGFDEFYGFLGGTCDYLPRDTPRDLFRGRERIDEPAYLTDAFAREAIAFIERPRENPFFLYLPFNAIHEPGRTQAGDRRFADIADAGARRYARMLASLDDSVGFVLDALDSTNQSDNTIVLFLSDNGGWTEAPYPTNGPLRLGKQYLFEGGIRVPLILRWPGITTADSTITTPVSFLDILPTLLTAAAITPPDSMPLDGLDLCPLLDPADPPPPDRPLFWRTGPAHAIRLGSFKLIRSHDSLWLFNLDDDPNETTNLAESDPDRVADLTARLDQWLSTLPEPDWFAGEVTTIDILGHPYDRAL